MYVNIYIHVCLCVCVPCCLGEFVFSLSLLNTLDDKTIALVTVLALGGGWGVLWGSLTSASDESQGSHQTGSSLKGSFP